MLIRQFESQNIFLIPYSVSIFDICIDSKKKQTELSCTVMIHACNVIFYTCTVDFSSHEPTLVKAPLSDEDSSLFK